MERTDGNNKKKSTRFTASLNATESRRKNGGSFQACMYMHECVCVGKKGRKGETFVPYLPFERFISIIEAVDDGHLVLGCIDWINLLKRIIINT